MRHIRDYWAGMEASLHREDNPVFYAMKAAEHAAFLRPEERGAGAIDLGCGAGELLAFLGAHVRVSLAQDFSAAMRSAAAARLGTQAPEITGDDWTSLLPGRDEPVWMTTGALNQYLPPGELEAFLDLFARHPPARALFLFDCVDPLRFYLLRAGIRYVDEPEGLRARARAIAYRTWLALLLLAGAPAGRIRRLGRGHMGWGQGPAFWRQAAASRGLTVEIVSSRAYEYRYHVALRKP